MAKPSTDRHAAKKLRTPHAAKRGSGPSRDSLLAFTVGKGAGPLAGRIEAVYRIDVVSQLAGGSVRIEARKVRGKSGLAELDFGRIAPAPARQEAAHLDPPRPFDKFVPAVHPEAVGESASDLWERLERITDALVKPMPDPDVELTRQAELRRRRIESFEKRHRLLTAAQVADLSGSESGNRSATATRWLGAGKIFAVTVHGQQRFPGFQFDEGGSPKPAIAAVLERLPFHPPGWTAALWFDTPHFALAGHARPAEFLDKNPKLVIEAAEQTARELAVEWL